MTSRNYIRLHTAISFISIQSDSDETVIRHPLSAHLKSCFTSKNNVTVLPWAPVYQVPTSNLLLSETNRILKAQAQLKRKKPVQQEIDRDTNVDRHQMVYNTNYEPILSY